MDVFVYGTLTDAATASAVLDDYAYRGDATLEGLHRVDGRYPTLAPGGTTEGRLLRTANATALDRYEGVDRGLYVRVSVPVASPENEAFVECYVGDPSALGVPVEWPGTGSLAERVRAYVHDTGVVVTT